MTDWNILIEVGGIRLELSYCLTNHLFVFKCQFAPEKFPSVKYDTVQCSLFPAEFVAFHKLLTVSIYF